MLIQLHTSKMAEYAYDTYMLGSTIEGIVEDLTYCINRYGTDYDEIAIYELTDDGAATIYYFKVVNDDGKYKGVIMFILKANEQRIDDNGELETHDIYISAPTIDECFEELVKYKDASELYITVEKVYLV